MGFQYQQMFPKLERNALLILSITSSHSQKKKQAHARTDFDSITGNPDVSECAQSLGRCRVQSMSRSGKLQLCKTMHLETYFNENHWKYNSHFKCTEYC